MEFGTKKLLATYLGLLFSLFGMCQMAIVTDPDGWTNVRQEPDVNAKVLREVNVGEFFFWYDFQLLEADSNWIPIYFSRNKFTLGQHPFDLLKGYIHKSRILPLDSMEEFRGSGFTFRYVLAPFDSLSGNKIIDKLNGLPHSINGRHMWGTDGFWPQNEVRTIRLTIQGVPVPIHEVFYSDIFDCTNTYKVYHYNNLFVVHQWNSDGAGAYELLWVFDKNGVRQRLVGVII